MKDLFMDWTENQKAASLFLALFKDAADMQKIYEKAITVEKDFRYGRARDFAFERLGEFLNRYNQPTK